MFPCQEASVRRVASTQSVFTGGRDMKAISKTTVGALVIASFLGGTAAVAVVGAGAPAAAVHPAPQAATAIEYALIAA
jgi:hypothetical protein